MSDFVGSTDGPVFDDLELKIIQVIHAAGAGWRDMSGPDQAAEIAAVLRKSSKDEISDAQVSAAMKEASRRSLMWRTSSDVKAVLRAAREAEDE